MNEIQRQRRIKDAASDQGEVQKIQILKQAEADAAETTLQAGGDGGGGDEGERLARQAVHISKALSRQVVEFDGAKVDMSERQVLDMMVMTQYVDDEGDRRPPALAGDDPRRPVRRRHRLRAGGEEGADRRVHRRRAVRQLGAARVVWVQ